MTIRSITGTENINIMTNNAMCATMSALVGEGVITNEFAEEFLNTHVCLAVAKNDGAFARAMTILLGKPQDENSLRCIVVKAIGG